MSLPSPPPPLSSAQRVRRKPAPSLVDDAGPIAVLALDPVARYPMPDPEDPFASLAMLRSRSSTLQGRVETVAFTVHPPSPTSSMSSDSEDGLEPLKPPTRPFTHRESHYRRYSQSIALSPPSSPAPDPASLPSLISDNATDVDVDSGDLSSCPSSTSRSRIARIFLPKRSSNASMASTARGGDHQRHRKVSTASISSPISRPFATNDHTLSTRASLDSRRLPLRLSADENSPPDSNTSLAFPSLNAHNRRSGVRPSLPRPSTARGIAHPTSHEDTPPAAHSDTSSFVHISTPSQSHEDHDASLDSSLASHLFNHGCSIGHDLPPKRPNPNEWEPPSLSDLHRAAALPIIAPSGIRVLFGDVFARERTIVVFIRHFWCPLCQDYMSSLASLAPRGANVVVISNGSPAMISKYKSIFGVEFQMYVDPEMEVYRALGMGVIGDMPKVPKEEAALSSNAAEGYVKRGMIGGIFMVVARALRVGMPVWEKGGEIDQLGGEFVFGPGMECTWAHRMQSAKGHAPVADVLAAGGIGVHPASPKSTKSRESMHPIVNGQRMSVSWSVEDKRKSISLVTADEPWVLNQRNVLVKPRKAYVADERALEERRKVCIVDGELTGNGLELFAEAEVLVIE